MAQVVVGLDVGSRTVRAARLKVGFRTMELEALLERPLGEDPWPAVKQLSQGADLLFTAIAGDAVSVRVLTLPAAAAKRVEQVLPFELDGDLPFDIQEMVIDHAVLTQGPERLEVMAVAARRSAVEAHLASMAELGLNPREVGAGALVHGELARLLSPAGSVAIVDVGQSTTDICICVAGLPTSARTSSAGGRDVTRALARAFGVPEAVAEDWKRSETYLGDWDLASLQAEQRAAVEAVRGAADRLVRDLQQALTAHAAAGRPAVERILLGGGGGALGGLAEHLSAALGLPVEPIVVPESVAGGSKHDGAGGCKAIALALRGTALRRKRVDLRRGDLAFAKEAGSGRGLFLYAVAAMLVIMLAWGFSAYATRVSLARRSETQYEELNAATERLLGEKVDTFGQLKTLLAAAASDDDDDSPLAPGDAFDVVEQVSKRIPREINHEIDSIDIRPGRTQIQGRVDQRRDADAIEAALSEWDACFSKVQVTRTTPAVREKRLQYTMDIETRCP